MENGLKVVNVNDIEMMLPDGMGKKELFNALQETEPVKELVGTEFKILGFMPEMAQVPKNDVNTETGEVIEGDGDELVERLRLTIITDAGTYHSYSTSLNKGLAKMLTIFGDEYKENTYKITTKMLGSGKDMKTVYILKVV